MTDHEGDAKQVAKITSSVFHRKINSSAREAANHFKAVSKMQSHFTYEVQRVVSKSSRSTNVSSDELQR